MRKKQLGQAMVEYIIVTAALISSLFWAANSDCDGDNCISKLLTVMHDNYEGYSTSMSSVQKYGEFTTVEHDDDDDDDGGGDGGGGDGGGGTTGAPGVLNSDGLTETNLVTGTGVFAANYGYLRADGTVVNRDGDLVGSYSEDDGTFTNGDGSSTVGVKIVKVVVDEKGNVLQIRAVTNCFTGQVYSWAYVSKASGKVFNTLNLDAMDIGTLCTVASFKVIKNGEELLGRMVNGYYYASAFAVNVSSTPLASTGEVIYWEDLNRCTAMAKGWDDDVDTNQDDEDIYRDQLNIFGDDEANLGFIDQFDYTEQTMIYGASTFANGCPSSRVIDRP